MRTLIVVVTLLVIGVLPALAQVPTVHAKNRFAWQQGAPDLATAQTGFAYVPREGTVPQAVLTGVTCTATTTALLFDCVALIGDRTPGPHTFDLITIDTTTLTPVESESASNPVGFTFRRPPVAPKNFGVRAGTP